jgi:prophage regulatory protein
MHSSNTRDILIEPSEKENQEEAMSMRFIRFKELRQRIPLGRTTIWRMMREGRFPQSRRIGKMAAAWLESEVEDWMKRNVEEGQTKENKYEQIRAV